MKSSRLSFAVVAAAALVAILLTFNSPVFNSLTAATLTRPKRARRQRARLTGARQLERPRCRGGGPAGRARAVSRCGQGLVILPLWAVKTTPRLQWNDGYGGKRAFPGAANR